MGVFGRLPERLDGLYVATETDILLLSDDLRRLVDASEERGSVLQSELNDVLEPLSLDPLEVDARPPRARDPPDRRRQRPRRGRRGAA